MDEVIGQTFDERTGGDFGLRITAEIYSIAGNEMVVSKLPFSAIPRLD
jgi:hypothetical protein